MAAQLQAAAQGETQDHAAATAAQNAEPQMSYTLTTDIEYEIDGESAYYPVIAITYRYSPGCGPFTYPGEYAPTDPPEPPEVEFESAILVDANGLTPEPTPQQVNQWGRDYIASNDGYRHACREAEETARWSDADRAYDEWRDEGRDRIGALCESYHEDDF